MKCTQQSDAAHRSLLPLPSTEYLKRDAKWFTKMVAADVCFTDREKDGRLKIDRLNNRDKKSLVSPS